MEQGNNSYGQETTMQDGWVKIGVLGCNSVIPRNVNEPPTGDGTAVGNAANAATADSLAVGDGAAAHGQKSVAIGSGSVASNDNECSVGAPATESTAESTREVTHVSEPTAPTSAANKAYVDGSINVIAPKTVATAAEQSGNSLAIGDGAIASPGAGGHYATAIGTKSTAHGDKSVAIGRSSAEGAYSVAIGDYAQANGYGTIAIEDAYAIGNSSFALGRNSATNAKQSVAIGTGALVDGGTTPDPNIKDYSPRVMNSVAIGSFSVVDEPRCVSVGNEAEGIDIQCRVLDSTQRPSETAPFWETHHLDFPSSARHLKRRIINVAEPIDWHNAANKNYVDANTSNALTGTAYGNPTAHVEDAWPFKPLELDVAGAYKQGDKPSTDDQVMMVTGADTSDASTYSQNGTPSPTNPVPIEVVENIVLRVTGADTSAEGASLPITLPAEHPYLAALPDGTRDEIVIDKDGNATLVARVQKVDVSNLPAPGSVETIASGLIRYQYGNAINTPAMVDSAAVAPAFKSVVNYAFPEQGMYVSKHTIIVGASSDPTDALKAGGYIYTTLAAPVTYSLGKLDIPALPETISNVWVESNIATMVRMMYKRDINTLLDRDKLPIASTTNRGTVKVGHGLDVDADGTLWVTESDSIPLAQTVTARTSEKNFAITGSPKDVASHKALMPVFNCGGYYSTFGGYFYLDLANSYKAGTKIHIELDVVWQDTHICSSIHRVAVVEIQQNTYTIPFGPSMYRDTDYNWYYWSFDVPVTADVPAKTQIHVNVF